MKPTIKEHQSTEIFMDYFHGTRIFLQPNTIIFSGNGYAKDIVLNHISRSVFDSIKMDSIGYFQGKMKQFGATKKDIEFYTGMLQFYITNK